MENDIILSELVRRCPNFDRLAAHRLSNVWTTLLDRIVSRMFDICEREVGLVLHIDQRPAAAFELRNSLLFLGNCILDHKAKVKPLDQYDPVTEAAVLDTVEERERIENTARNWADGVWKPLTAKWRERRPLIERPDRSGVPPKLRKPTKTPYRKHMHHVPQSTTRQWACAKSGKFAVYTIGLDGEVQTKLSTPKQWGAAPSIYTQGLEHLLGLVENDVRRPYQSLVNVAPLDDLGKRCWIAFLITQMIRTPRFMRMMFNSQRAWIERKGFPYPTDPAHLGRAYETLFQSNKLYAALYRRITARAWGVVRAATGLTFLKGDNPVVINGSTVDKTWRLVYPLTPRRCFIAGPALEDEPSRIVPRQRQLTDAETLAVNAEVCAFAETSVIGVSVPDRIDPKPMVKAQLGKKNLSAVTELPLWGLDRTLVS